MRVSSLRPSAHRDCSSSSVFVNSPRPSVSSTPAHHRSAACCSAIAGNGMAPAVLVSSCTGKMGQSVGEAVLRAGLELLPYTLCGPGEDAHRSHVEVGGVKLELIPPSRRASVLKQLHDSHAGRLIAVDYTLAQVIHQQVDFYVESRTPFVMGTTGGDRAQIERQVQDAGLFAVIAPNMGKQIVAFQATMESMARTYPGAFAGYKMRVVESHQSTKQDTSGTAKAIVKSFQGLGVQFADDEIELVRTPKEQVERMKVPEEALLGHAFHTYQLVSPDGTVSFEFQHNVVGRTVYAEGTVDAVLFLAKQMQAPQGRTLFNMIDVLSAGAMR